MSSTLGSVAIGNLQIGSIPFPLLRSRQDAGAIEIGRANLGAVIVGGVIIPLVAVATATAGGIPEEGARKRRYIVRRGDKLLVFTNAQEAYEVAQESDEPQEVTKPLELVTPKKNKKKRKVYEPKPEPQREPKPVAAVAPVETVNLDYVLALALARGRERAVAEMLELARYRALMDLIWDMQDEEDVEMLLLAA